MKMISKVVSVGTRKIRASVTSQMVEDIRFYGIDAEHELEMMLEKEMNEIVLIERKKKIKDLLENGFFKY